MFAIYSGFDFSFLTIALYLNCWHKMDKVQTGGRFNANDEVFNSSAILLHKRRELEFTLEFKYVNSSCKDETKHLCYSFV